MANNKYHIVTINTGSGYQSFQDMLLHLQDEPKYAKKWPCIVSSDLLKQLENFMSCVVINGFGIENGVLFIKPTGRQVDGSHRYYFCKESPDGKICLHKKIGAGPDKGKFFKVLTNKEESVDMLIYIINHMKHIGKYPTIKDTEQYYEDAQIMSARERIQICLNMVHSGVDITHRKTSIDYAIDLLPAIKAISMTLATIAATEPASEQNNSSLGGRSSLTSSATVATSPPSNDIYEKPTKRTNAAADITNSSSTQITQCSTPIIKRLRRRKQAISDVTSPSSNGSDNSSTHSITLQASTSSSAIGDNRRKKRLNKLFDDASSTIPTLHNDTPAKKKIKTRRRK